MNATFKGYTISTTELIQKGQVRHIWQIDGNGLGPPVQAGAAGSLPARSAKLAIGRAKDYINDNLPRVDDAYDDDAYLAAQAGSISGIVCDYVTAMAMGNGSGVEG